MAKISESPKDFDSAWKIFCEDNEETIGVNRSLGTKGKRFKLNFNINMSLLVQFFLQSFSPFLEDVLYQKFDFQKNSIVRETFSAQKTYTGDF